ncbi:hypothetical protein OCU04_010467 [Sclerotinia nivalis]|uniref:Uncharacterized protein n=1 Tax=Sclerotinia nivalis TaxID=352851 RepID=A0A9X0ADC4_9HELO|nr:hypothetical protein OCU04_010467 [Sclerotinia nivalis]
MPLTQPPIEYNGIVHLELTNQTPSITLPTLAHRPSQAQPIPIIPSGQALLNAQPTLLNVTIDLAPGLLPPAPQNTGLLIHRQKNTGNKHRSATAFALLSLSLAGLSSAGSPTDILDNNTLGSSVDGN